MNSKDRLYNLIHSMSPNEKGYFKKFVASDHGSKAKKYLQVFELFDKQKVYSKTDLEKKFEKKRIGGDLNSIRSYLYKLVLKSLRSFWERKSVMVDLCTNIQNASILDQHGLYEQAIDEIHKVVDKADELGNYGLVMDMMTEEINILKRLNGNNKVYDRMLQLIDDHTKHLQLLETIFEMHDLFCRIQMLDGRFNTDKLSKMDSDELKQLILENRKKCITNAALIQSVYLDVQMHVVQQDGNKVQSSLNRAKELIGKNSLLSKRRSNLELYNKVMEVGFSMNSFSPVKEDLKEIEELRKYVLSKRRSALANDYFNALLLVHVLLMKVYLLRPDEFTKLNKYMHEIEKNIEKLKSFVYHQHNLNVLLCEMAGYYFVNQEYKKSVSKVDAILRAKNMSYTAVQLMKCLHVINHYELGNLLYLESVVRSFNRNRKRKEKYSRAEGLFLRFFRKLISAPDKKTRDGLFVSFRNELVQLGTERPEEKIWTQNLFLNKWLTAKVENKSLLEVLKEKERRSI